LLFTDPLPFPAAAVEPEELGMGGCVLSSTSATAVDDRLRPPKTLVVFDPGDPGETDDEDGGLKIFLSQGANPSLIPS